MVRHSVNSAIDSILHDGSLPAIESLQTYLPDHERFMVGISTLLDPRYVFLIYAPILFALNKNIGHRVVIALSITEWANQILKWLLAGERPYWYVHERSIQLSRQIAIEPIQLDQLDPQQKTLSPYEFASDLNLTLNDKYLHNYKFFYQREDNNLFTDILRQQQSQEYLPIAQLRQFPVTCELGAGSPSGHAMVTATVWYVLIDSFLKSELKYKLTNNIQTGISSSFISWTIYTFMLIAVSVSRVYLACHFPHQCICGAALGLLVGWFVCEKMPIDKLEKIHFCLAAITMFVTALATYAILGSFGFDPLWSVHKGKRWCIKPEYIHLDTTPFFSMMRYIGFCLGSGLAFEINQASKTTTTTTAKTKDKIGQVYQIALTAIVSILFGQFILSLPISSGNQMIGYAISCVNYVIFSYAIAGPIPKIITSYTNGKTLRIE